MIIYMSTNDTASYDLEQIKRGGMAVGMRMKVRSMSGSLDKPPS